MTEKHASIGPFLALILPLVISSVMALAVVCLLSNNRVQARGLDTTITVNSTIDQNEFNNIPGDCSLREAIQAANTDTVVDACPAGSGADTILLPPGVYTLTIAGAREDANATGDLDITSTVTILGEGASSTIIDGNQLDRVFHILTGADAMIAWVTVRNGHAPDGIDGPVGGDGETGGAVHNAGILTMSNCNIVNNQSGSGGNTSTDGDGGLSGHGGGIFNSGRMVLNHSILSDNQAGDGGDFGGLCTHNTPGGFGGGLYNTGIVTITECKISTNHTGFGGTEYSSSYCGISMSGDGGGIYNANGLFVVDSIIGDNSTGFNRRPGYGAGIYNAGTTTMDNSTIIRNLGNGVYNAGTTTMDNSTIISNTRSGVYNAAGTTTMDNSTIISNRGYRGGGIYNAGTAMIDNSTIISNTTTYNYYADKGGDGGGIYNMSNMTLRHSSIISNTTSNGGCTYIGHGGTICGEGGEGGGVYNAGNLLLANSTVSHNITGKGGGLSNFIEDSGDGGGIYNANALSLYNSTVSSNRTGDGGGTTTNDWGGDAGDGAGIYNADTLILINSTVSNNRTGDGAPNTDMDLYLSPNPNGNGGDGAGIFNTSVVTINNGTITGNQNGVGGIGLGSDGHAGAGGGISTTGFIQMRNTLIAGNLSENAGPDCSGIITSNGYNLVGDSSDCTVFNTATDIISTPNAFLFPIADNGGDTWTHALMPGSRAIDAGSCLDSNGNSVTVDQRGVVRPIGFTCDIGAYEAPEYPKFYLTVVMR